ncbi:MULTISPECIES: DUF1707 SHOCT-like domain-containing protein [unclassified Saccharothrix]|uniref:DUF1707 SHOCT-like domain-containing protein n=1 Tax=unclassified Saccharothrix TaxID=2593673 RepID=UPI00307D111B
MTHPIPPPADGVRVSDAERDAVAARLRDAVGEGRLTLAEAEDRIAAAYAAVHRSDLAPLTVDLPPPPGPSPLEPTHRPGRAPHPWWDGRRPPVLAVVGVIAVVAWIASPLPFPWPLLLVAFLVLRHRARHRPT